MANFTILNTQLKDGNDSKDSNITVLLVIYIHAFYGKTEIGHKYVQKTIKLYISHAFLVLQQQQCHLMNKMTSHRVKDHSHQDTARMHNEGNTINNVTLATYLDYLLNDIQKIFPIFR